MIKGKMYVGYKKNCAICGKEYFTIKSRVDTSKYCSIGCCHIGQRGEKRPHDKEWEENRLKAVRANAWKNKGRENPKSKETIKIALAKYKELIKQHPEKYRQISINNLPKDITGDNNGNWRNGVSKTNYNWRTAHSSEYKQWRNAIVERDKKCVTCGSADRLEAHHIYGMSEYKDIAFELWNGITLCRRCHQKTGSWDGNRKKEESKFIHRTVILFIPSEYQEYATVGNYKDINGNRYILISDTGNTEYNCLIALHELVEQCVTGARGISEQTITEFDKSFEAERTMGLHDKSAEPGCDARSPYREEHLFAESIEKMVADELGISWDKYNEAVMSI